MAYEEVSYYGSFFLTLVKIRCLLQMTGIKITNKGGKVRNREGVEGEKDRGG